MSPSAAIADPLFWGTELRVASFMFRVVRKVIAKTRNPELETFLQIMPDGNGRYQCACCILQQRIHRACGVLPDGQGPGSS
jgi:hypothetical protein